MIEFDDLQNRNDDLRFPIPKSALLNDHIHHSPPTDNGCSTNYDLLAS